ncbi:TonB-dependent siderophore receptor [Verminephrobacter aporrectodeae subsp. tuberculatae]|uniref:TonB-dependent siderophore receptor n=1 Tax=Verminephrobacter aporrectodeae TaxID=1110389 RepID=UPI002242D16A|nr:TonB-dependent siderophore receptor [Verminephrobacter aporrectodeae]MCW8197957.1 TonB-dependent siderophore receptor [Verminephrobacter aporrectodeae subsp. tuberculatae]
MVSQPLRVAQRAARPFATLTTRLPLALCLAQAAWAQTEDAPAGASAAPPQMQEVRIDASADRERGFAPADAQTAGKALMRRLETPQSVSVVTREQMESRQITNLQQALQTVAGVSPVNYGRRGFDDIHIRGFRATESILVDGLVQGPGIRARMQPYGYERFEVLKGAASVLYGQVQPGGIVNAVSKRPRREALNEAGIELGSFGLRTLQADLNRPLSASGKTALRISAQVSDSDDPTDFVYRKDRWLAAALALDPGPDTDLVLLANHSRNEWLRQQGLSPYGTVLPNPNGRLPRTLFTGDPGLGAYDMQSSSVGYALEHRFSPAMALRQNLRYETGQGTGDFVSNLALQADRRQQNRSLSRQSMDSDMLATDTSLLSRFAALGAQHQLVTGLDLRRGRDHWTRSICRIGALDLFAPRYGMAATCPAAPSSDAPSRLTVAGLYAQDQIRFDPNWTALLGLRRDSSTNHVDNRVSGVRTRQRDGATTLSAGLVHAFRPGWAAYASYGESFLPVGGLTFGGTPLVPETGEQWEAGLKYESFDGALGGQVTGALALFDLVRQNVRTTDREHPGFSVQTGEQRARGLELELGADLRSGWKLTGAYSWTQTKVTRDNNAAIVGRPLNLTPRHTLATWATYQLPQSPRTTLGLGGRCVSEQIGAHPFTLPAYCVADASVRYQGPSYRVAAGVRNLFNRAYYDGAINADVVSPAAPRSLSLGLTYFF